MTNGRRARTVHDADHDARRLIPPRQGKRHKSDIAPPFNRGRPLTVVTVDDRMGVLDESGPVPRVWFEQELFSVALTERDAVRRVTIPPPSVFAYDEETSTIGGVGRTLRWNVVLPRKQPKTTPRLFVANISDRDAFLRFAETLKPFAFVVGDFETARDEDDVESHSVIVEVPDGDKVGIVAAKLHAHEYGALLDTEECQGKLGIERMDRSEHMWWNQNRKTAGPLRDTHRWKYAWCTWSYLPFNWHLMALNFQHLTVDECAALPLPLRNYVVDAKADAVDADDATVEALRRLKTERHCATAALTARQNVQLLTATYYMINAPFDARVLRACHLLQLRYCLHGYTGREVGGYRQSALHLGHGAYIRKFKGKEQYHQKNMTTDVLNRVCRADGTCMGSGFKGTRGKYGHSMFPEYRPHSKMKRTREVELRMRAPIRDYFSEYALTQSAESAENEESAARAESAERATSQVQLG